MFIPKQEAKSMCLFHLVDPLDLKTFEEWVLWLESILHNPCSVFERDGRLLLIENKQIIERVNGLRIEIYPNEHPPPHFHVKSPNINASFAIEDCRQLMGNVSTQNAQKIKYWHSFSKQKLIEAWNHTRPTNCIVGPYIEN